VQIYGAYGKLLAAYPEADSLFKLNEYCRKGGAAFCLPTIATNTLEVFHRSIDAVRDYWKQDGKGILGLHPEGPWINPIKRGAHIESLIHSPSLKEAEELLNYGKGVIKMITLAPEVCSKEIIDLILSHNIIVSAGHSNATYNEAIQGFENGITTVTHLYNAMSPLQHRAPGLVGATLDLLWCNVKYYSRRTSCRLCCHSHCQTNHERKIVCDYRCRNRYRQGRLSS
jgi:N-acetylglucosamine-6-phosphate deacetylase